MKIKLQKVIANILSISMLFSTVSPAFADEFSDTGLAGQAFGQEAVDSFNDAPPSISGGVMTIPLTGGGTSSVNVNDLFPGTSSTGTQPLSDFFPAGAEPNTAELEGVSSDGDAMNTQGENIQSILWNDASLPEPTSTSGMAYKIMMDMANQPRPDLKDDPVFNTTRSTFDNIDEISATFGDCTTSTVLTDIGNTTHIPDYKNCERIIDKTARCDVTHVLDAGLIQHVSGPYNIMPTPGINDSLDVWIGTVGNNYWGGWCTIYEQTNSFRVISPSAIQSVTLNRAVYDDYMQVWVGREGQEQLVWSGPNGNFPPETAGACELSTSWNQNPNLDITSQFLASIDAGDVVRFKIRVSVAGNGEGFAKLTIRYDQSQVVEQDVWVPQDCVNAANEALVGIDDGFATGSVSCTAMPNNLVTTPESTGYDNFGNPYTIPATTCQFINEVNICEDDIQTPPLPGIPKFCETVAVDINYDYYQGQLDCYEAANGDTVCPTSGGGVLDTCVQYEDDPACGFISADCVEGSESASGTCYIFNEVWDCGTDVTIPDVQSTLEVDCTGPVRCMGDDCIDPNKTESASFAEVSAKLQAAQFMSQDMNCVEVTGTTNVTCSVFGGDGFTCKKALGGVQDCCDVPTEVTMGTYLRGIMSVGVLDSGIMNLNLGSGVKGAWEVIRTPVADTVSSVTEPFTSYIDSISGSVTEFFQPVTDYVTQLVADMQAAIDGVIQDMLSEAGAEMGADAAASATADQAVEDAAADSAIGSAASALMTAYTAYVVAVMVVQIVWECEKPEFELAAKKATESCQYLGSYCASDVLGVCIEKRESYCCFNSPLSRIINAQVRPQLGVPYGDLRNPNCEGLTMDQIALIDWTLIDLSEWTAILAVNDLMPDVNAMTLDSLTGSGNTFNLVDPDVERLDAEQRTIERIGAEDIDQHRKDAASNTLVNPAGTPTP